jgi:hypothetical protein
MNLKFIITRWEIKTQNETLRYILEEKMLHVVSRASAFTRYHLQNINPIQDIFFSNKRTEAKKND